MKFFINFIDFKYFYNIYLFKMHAFFFGTKNAHIISFVDDFFAQITFHYEEAC